MKRGYHSLTSCVLNDLSTMNRLGGVAVCPAARRGDQRLEEGEGEHRAARALEEHPPLQLLLRLHGAPTLCRRKLVLAAMPRNAAASAPPDVRLPRIASYAHASALSRVGSRRIA